MAKLTKAPVVYETVTVESGGGVTLELTAEEAQGLARLVRGGTGSATLNALGLWDLLRAFNDTRIGESTPDFNVNNWASSAQLKGVN